ncbi:MAG: type II CAAX endopeptidase family protein [Phycisphaerales bacterium]|jgi:membrane protease YdiL (CAAX protease family)|nr:type II CAAX endopeptidase family protein [Phycisphaerales bacterium]
MNDPLDTSENTPEPTSETAKKQPSRARNTVWGLVLAWATILISIVLWSSKTTLMDIFGKTGEISESASEPDSIPDGLLVSLQEEVIGQIAFSLYSLTGDPNSVLQAAPIESIGPAGEVAYAILLGSISGPEKGLESLSKIADSQDPILELLVPAATSALKAAADETPVDASTAALLEERLGWFGRLASNLPDAAAMKEMEASSRSSMTILIALLLVFILGGLIGFVVGIVLLIFSLLGRLPSRIHPVGPHGIYAETFAIWMLVFFVMQVSMGLLLPADAPTLAWSTGLFFLSLVALAWPVVRGVSFSQMRKDIGLHWGGGLREFPFGILNWMIALPLLLIGAILTFGLSTMMEFLTGQAPTPSHPAQQAAVGAEPWTIVQLYVLACIAAPIVEETMFRGVLLTHLRGAMRRWSTSIAIVFSAVISSVIFAAIHPQGLIFIPPLAGLAIGFCVGRELRGSLVAPMVAHGFSNALVMTINVVMFAG